VSIRDHCAFSLRMLYLCCALALPLEGPCRNAVRELKRTPRMGVAQRRPYAERHGFYFVDYVHRRPSWSGPVPSSPCLFPGTQQSADHQTLFHQSVRRPGSTNLDDVPQSTAPVQQLICQRRKLRVRSAQTIGSQTLGGFIKEKAFAKKTAAYSGYHPSCFNITTGNPVRYPPPGIRGEPR